MTPRQLTDAARAQLFAEVMQTLATRPRGEGMPLGEAAKLLKKADRAGMTLPQFIALYNARAERES